MQLVLMTVEDVLAVLPWTRTTLYRNIKCGTFPKPAKIGHRLAWKASDVESWLDARFVAAGAPVMLEGAP